MSFLSNLLQGLSGRRRLFLFALLVALSAVLLTLWASDDLLTTSVVGGIVVLLFALASPLWRPRDYGRMRVRLYSLAIISGTALSYGFWSASLTAIAQPFLGHFELNLPQLRYLWP
ncbi:hypothetical protein [Candidatus Thiosymbion oneisti]|uniref:hypothetical protein n=1 Tax=Candidatus Thiosymbion oneisti TaxID=589554 RepID=UPI000B7E24E8|nr:hypothetical protein [Candidatus Thiosymbion oneisti]